MVEWLAIPRSGALPCSLQDWIEALSSQGCEPAVESEGAEASWLEIAPMRLRGYASLEGPYVEAINFELHAADPAEAHSLIARVADSLHWELHEDDDDEDD